MKGVTPGDLGKSPWLSDPSFPRSSSLSLKFAKSAFYKQDITGRDLHLQLLGAMVPAKFTQTGADAIRAELSAYVPVWSGMRAVVVDLNGKPLRIAGGATCIL